jgi:hypothetical protein
VSFDRGALGVFRYALHGKAKLTQVIPRDMQDNIAVVKVGGILATVAK